MSKKTTFWSKVILTSIALGTVVVGGIIAYTVLLDDKSTERAVGVSSFDFNASKAPGWWAANSMNSDDLLKTHESTSETLAARRVISQGTQKAPGGDCFVMYSYYMDSSRDPRKVLSDITATGSAHSLELVETVNLSMRTTKDTVPFELHQYRKVGSDMTGVSAGESYAVFRAGTGYVEIRGVCKTAEQLVTALPVFSAVSFNEQ